MDKNAAAIADLTHFLGSEAVAVGTDAAKWSQDWTGNYRWTPLCVARPANTQGVAAVLRIASAHGLPIVPVSGNTGLSGGTVAEGAIMLSVDRMNHIREIRRDSRIMVVEAGVILSEIHVAAEAEGLVFPLTFGARGSARIGGCLATNAGGSNVLRYGNVRALCLGIEVVLPSGDVLDLMSAVHKDNSGYDLRDLFIGAEGTLGVITAAVLRLFPRPRAYATAMVAAAHMGDGLRILNRLQEQTGGMVEAFEYMPRHYVETHLKYDAAAREPFGDPHDINLLVELGATSPDDAEPGRDGVIPVVRRLEDILGDLMEQGLVLDAILARSEAQRSEMWARREAAAELTVTQPHVVINDIALPLERVPEFLDRAIPALREIDPCVRDFVVSHLGDGNVHYNIWPSTDDAAQHERLREKIEDLVAEMRGSFSAEHGIGTSRIGSMIRRKDPVALQTMRAIRRAIDPSGLMNPGKTIPE